MTDADLHAIIAKINRLPDPVPGEAASAILRTAISQVQAASSIADGAGLPGKNARARLLSQLMAAEEAGPIGRFRLAQLAGSAISAVLEVQDGAKAQGSFSSQTWSDALDGAIRLVTDPVGQIKEAVSASGDLAAEAKNRAVFNVGDFLNHPPSWIKMAGVAVGALALILLAAEIASIVKK